MTSTGRNGPHDNGEPLTGDGVTPGIVRIGDTVRRPVRPFTRTVQAYLAHLHQAGFTAAPVPLGTDDQGREILSFVPGDVPRNPLPPETAGEDVLAALARLIRALHEASAGWTPPPDAAWGGIPRPAGTALTVVDEPPELVSHRDYCPGNVVFRDGLPAALIDFDLTRPTTRLYDIANALWWWAPLRDPRDRTPAFTGLDIPRRAAVFANALPDDRAAAPGPHPAHDPHGPSLPPQRTRRRRRRPGLQAVLGTRSQRRAPPGRGMARAGSPRHSRAPHRRHPPTVFLSKVFRQLRYLTPPEVVYPEEAINGHGTFIARRRELRPSEEYRTPTDEEWREFLGHFERRRVLSASAAAPTGPAASMNTAA